MARQWIENADEQEPSETVLARTVLGRTVMVRLASIEALTADPDDSGQTRLHAGDELYFVEGNYEGWMNRLSAQWTGDRRP